MLKLPVTFRIGKRGRLQHVRVLFPQMKYDEDTAKAAIAPEFGVRPEQVIVYDGSNPEQAKKVEAEVKKETQKPKYTVAEINKMSKGDLLDLCSNEPMLAEVNTDQNREPLEAEIRKVLGLD